MKKWQRYTFIGLAILIVAAIFAGAIFQKKMAANKSTATNQSSVQTPAATTPTPTPETPAPTTTAPTIQTSYYYPMSNYASRVTVRWFGKYVTPAQQAPTCGAPFTGYHDGDDLEVTAPELNADVPVYAIADGTVRSIGHVSGYGGLLIIGVNINGQDYTVNYGHINLGSTSLRVGDSVKAGQKLASLGAQCSAQTDGERKHLHFAIHRGSGIDVRGYLPTSGELANWVNPKDFLASINAK